ncbi:hypothetical protein [Paraburkholderia sp. BL9I2N2]|uniref:hypothetical protein n=1 Tax=Paraburkholderia sp. BL9I2N2 TaxID=1938809 RepID=UPI001042E2A6|nr:hypothetical protein [Paraburkholderia sp. BL9I2N2]TCK96231.1 hypothetical protein B0G74_2890 [Paraburkholderia sp. BL9I2N2]
MTLSEEQKEYYMLKAHVEQLENDKPDIVVQVEALPNRMVGFEGRAILRRVVLNHNGGLFRVETQRGNANWNPTVMRVIADGLKRSNEPRVEFIEVLKAG